MLVRKTISCFGAVDFHQGGDAAHDIGIIGEGGGIAQGNDFIAQDATGHRQGLEDFAGHVLLGAGHPEDAALQEIEEMGEVHIRLVEDDNLSGADGGAEFAGAFGVVFPRGVDDGEAGKEAVEIEPQMALGRRLAPAVFGPVHAGGDQLDGGRIDHMDDAPETPGDSFAAIATGKGGLEGLQMAEHRPENLFRQAGVPLLVGMGVSGACDVVVVDNGSAGPVPSEFTRPRPGVRLLTRRENGGYAVGVNAGWRTSRSPWLLLLNPDVVLGKGQLDRVAALAAGFEAAPGNAPGVVGFALLSPDGSPRPSVGVFPDLSRTLREQLIPRSRRKYQTGWPVRPGIVDWVTGACMLVSSRLLDVLGGLDEDFFLYYEEVALCRMAHRLGWRVEYDPRVVATRLSPLQNRPISPMLRIITRHSKLLYFRKHLKFWQFSCLSWVICWEAVFRGGWAWVRGCSEQARAWGTTREISRMLWAGIELRGSDVRAGGGGDGDGKGGHSFAVGRTGRASIRHTFFRSTRGLSPRSILRAHGVQTDPLPCPRQKENCPEEHRGGPETKDQHIETARTPEESQPATAARPRRSSPTTASAGWRFSPWQAQETPQETGPTQWTQSRLQAHAHAGADRSHR